MIKSDFVSGHIVNLKATHPLHYGSNADPKRNPGTGTGGSFSSFLTGAINRVNSEQIKSEELIQKMVYEPESVDIHTVMIAAQKAEISLTFTKAIRDEAIRAFRDIINLR